MNIYKQVEMEVSKTYKPSQAINRHNKLIELRYKTEDTRLHEYISFLLTGLIIIDRIYGSKLPYKTSVKMQELKSVENELIAYCRNIYSQNKPEWQVLAERNGWAPRSAK